MLLSQGVNRFNWSASNYTVPSATPGTSVTPGASNAEGSWTSLIAGASITEDVFGLYVYVGGGNSSGAAKNHLLDIGIDPAGGTSFGELIPNILCSQSQAVTTGGCQFYFPIRIPQGASIGCRVRGSNATAGTVRVVVKAYGQPTRPDLIWAGNYAETLGITEASSVGTTVTPGNAAEGSWTAIGTTTKPAKFLQVGMGVNNGTITAQYALVDIGFYYSSGASVDVIMANKHLGFYGTAEIAAWLFDYSLFEGWCEIPEGVTLCARIHCSTAPATGYNIGITCIG